MITHARRVAFCAAIACAASLAGAWSHAVAAAQSRDVVRAPAIGTARIAGRVVSAGDPAGPIHRAIVTLGGGETGVPRSVVSDDEGRFTFDRLPAGRFTLTASKAAYVATSYGAKKPGLAGSALVIAEGQQVTGVTLTLVRGGVIAGAIRKPSGEPAPGLRVTATRTGQPISRSILSSISATSDSTFTDDRGAYRIFGLLPGEYTVAAVPAGAQSVGELHHRSTADVDAILRDLQSRAGAPPAVAAAPEPAVYGVSPIFYPGTPVAADATAVSLAAGESREDVDFIADVVPSASIEGMVVRSGDLAGVPITLVISGAGQTTPIALPFAPRLARPPGPDGRFKYVNVTPGHYTISALARPASVSGQGDGASQPAVSMFWASAELDVNGQDLSGVSLTFQPALRLTGRVVFDAATLAVPADLGGVLVSLETLPGRDGTAMSNNTAYGGLQRTVFGRVGPDGTFAIDGLTPGPYRVAVKGSAIPSGFWLRSVIADGRDVLDDPLDVRPAQDLTGVVVTFTDRHSGLDGVLQTAEGQPASGYFVVAVPTNRALWGAERRVRWTRPATDGRFEFADLPPGEYAIAALADLDPEDLKRPALLADVVAAGLRVSLAEGEHKRQDLRIRGVTPR